jgi:hypothetical protein
LTCCAIHPTIQNIEIILEKSRHNGAAADRANPTPSGASLDCEVIVLDEDLQLVQCTPAAQGIDVRELVGAVGAARSARDVRRVVASIAGVDTELAATQIDLVGGQHATVVLIARYPGALDAHPTAIEAAVSRVALELLRARAAQERQARIFDVLSSGAGASVAQAAELGIDLRGGNAFVAVDSPGPQAIGRRLLTQGSDGDPPPAAVFDGGDALFALLAGLDRAGAERRLGETVSHGLAQAYPERLPRIAFAGPHYGAAGAQRALAECRQALQVLSVIPPTEPPIGFDELGIWTVLASADREQLSRFRDAILAPLVAHDARRRSQLVETLRALVYAGFNWRPASAALAVHPNTVRYRMSVITKLTGLDLGSYSDQVKADIALRSAELLASA